MTIDLAELMTGVKDAAPLLVAEMAQLPVREAADIVQAMIAGQQPGEADLTADELIALLCPLLGIEQEDAEAPIGLTPGQEDRWDEMAALLQRELVG